MEGVAGARTGDRRKELMRQTHCVVEIQSHVEAAGSGKSWNSGSPVTRTAATGCGGSVQSQPAIAACTIAI